MSKNIVLTTLIILGCIGSLLYADVPKSKKKSIMTAGMMSDASAVFDYNEIYTDITNNGLFIDYHISGDSGMEWPKGTGVHSIFQSALWLGAIVNGETRVVIGDYTQDMGPGSWGGDPTDAKYRIYIVNIDMLAAPSWYPDFQNWPVDQGAPWVDVDGDGVYSPLPTGLDHPKFYGDQVAWFVSNDGDPAYKLNMGTSPLDVEVQTTVYAFDRPTKAPKYSDVIFYRNLIINKGTNSLEETYVGVWSDPDLGYAGDDFVGVDVPRSLGYVWNDGDDSQYTTLPIGTPAAGYDFLQGPMVDCLTDGTTTIELRGSDPDGDPITYSIVSTPANGTISLSGSTVTYTPNTNWTGTDFFTYKASDGVDDSAVGTVYILVSDPVNKNQTLQSPTEIPHLLDQIKKDDYKLDKLMIKNRDALITAIKDIDYSDQRDANGFVRCGTDELEQELQLLDPEFIKERDKFFAQVRANKEIIDFSNTMSVFVPVIFHVLYSSTSENISATQIGYNFDQLNLDFQNINTDGSKVPQAPNPTNAPQDPGLDYNHYGARGTHNVLFVGFDGERTGGDLNENTTIRRYQMSQSTVSGVNEASSLVGSITPDGGGAGGYQEGYLNVYIAPLSGGLLGQASFSIPHTAISTETVGSVDHSGTSTIYGLGRTLTHEVGHNFSYNHIFNSNNCSDQLWSDIPAQTSSNGSSANLYEFEENWYGKGALNSCMTTSGKGDQFMNYMDYSADLDLVMFSAQQAQDGYAWALTKIWATVANQAPVVNDLSINVAINEDCSQGAQMFGTFHPGKKNLSMSSFTFYINGDATYTDPSDEIEGYYYMKGLRKDGSVYPNAIAGDDYNQNFAFYGDPNQTHSTSNPVDGNYTPSADRRFLMNVGPFTMAPGDSQEVVFAILHAAGGGALASLDSLKAIDTRLQNDYDNRFSIFESSATAVADLQASITSGYVPLTVNFDGTNSSPVDNYYWDFDNDGVTDSKAATPTYVFTTPGTYNTQLDVRYKDFVEGYATLNVVEDSVTVTVLSPNPTVSDASYTIDEDTATTITLTGTDPQNQSLAFQIEQHPVHATISLSGSSLTYTPDENFVGEDSLKYSATNGNYGSNIGKISVQVNAVDDDPTTFNVTATTDEDTAVEVTLSAEEYDGDSYSFTIKQTPSHGSLSAVSGSTVTYTPNTDWFGVDKFTYEATDDRFAKINTATAIITVNPINDAPTTGNMNVTTYEDLVTSIALDVNDIDGDNLSLTYSGISHGSLSVPASQNLYVVYTPNENYNGTDSFVYTVNDGVLSSNTSTVSIILNPVNDASSDFTVSEEYVISSSDGEEWIITTNNLVATPENEQDLLEFVWNESIDIDGDQVQYRMIGYDDLEFLTMDEWTTNLSQSWSVKDLVANTDTVNIAQGSWLVVATDGEFFKESNYGTSVEFLINGVALIPDVFTISQNYPNPFTSSTTIDYDVPQAQHIAIRIYDIRGRLIKTLMNEEQNAGYKSITWDGTNDDGEKVSAGVYFYQMHTSNGESFTKSKKLLKLN